jgi:hypothetical protein
MSTTVNESLWSVGARLLYSVVLLEFRGCLQP